MQTERDDDQRYQSREEYYDDRYLRMRVHNRMQWSVLDDYYFGDRCGYTYYNTGILLVQSLDAADLLELPVQSLLQRFRRDQRPQTVFHRTADLQSEYV